MYYEARFDIEVLSETKMMPPIIVAAHFQHV